MNIRKSLFRDGKNIGSSGRRYIPVNSSCDKGTRPVGLAQVPPHNGHHNLQHVPAGSGPEAGQAGHAYLEGNVEDFFNFRYEDFSKVQCTGPKNTK